ncbi:hypothetical protein BD309DRAFT_947165 [Dichomitus squalens]|nr:hypothetical protein BD309DRAFT_947165 [Dichomitus squalens]
MRPTPNPTQLPNLHAIYAEPYIASTKSYMIPTPRPTTLPKATWNYPKPYITTKSYMPTRDLEEKPLSRAWAYTPRRCSST